LSFMYSMSVLSTSCISFALRTFWPQRKSSLFLIGESTIIGYVQASRCARILVGVMVRYSETSQESKRL
jgi:hypothetical protein